MRALQVIARCTHSLGAPDGVSRTRRSAPSLLWRRRLHIGPRRRRCGVAHRAISHGAVIHRLHRLHGLRRGGRRCGLSHYVASVWSDRRWCRRGTHYMSGVWIAGGWRGRRCRCRSGRWCRHRHRHRMSLMLRHCGRSYHRSAQQGSRQNLANAHAPPPGPTTVTVCIIPPCI